MFVLPSDFSEHPVMDELQRVFWMIDAMTKWPHPDPVLQEMRLRELVTQFYALAAQR